MPHSPRSMNQCSETARARDLSSTILSFHPAQNSWGVGLLGKVGIILLPSNENAASCYLLDLMEQSDLGSAGRPWANAYIAHVRALSPIWRASSFTATEAADWAGFLMAEGLVSARSRTPMVVTSQDQLLLSGPEPPSLETLLSSLENSANDSSLSFLWASMRPYMFHATRLSRQMYDTITGDFARINPLSEVAVRNLIDSLSKLRSILDLLLDRVDMVTTPPGSNAPTILDDSSIDAVARASAYGVCFGFSGLVLPFYRELQYRETIDSTPQSERTRARMQALRAQAHDMAVLGLRELARGIRFLPKIHYSPVHWPTIRAWAEFAAEEADMEGRGPLSPEAARDLETVADEMKLLGYSVDTASTPQTHALIERLEGHINQALVSMFLPITENAWPVDDGIIADGGELILP
ncbi:Zn(2)-C6 fungal-type domain-containing protein [Mycena sanguinolenta]|uniref:Zn(2)-C6 fungal-type domain-containing protein n=1 Tax=Mycena sanguinolenta TaxID=230812 RepID=A0A8H7DLP3_9AGAR|nr:Zn(2)-C6 fungal-type domain-containing protein [Mycena sanguinolenta]